VSEGELCTNHTARTGMTMLGPAHVHPDQVQVSVHSGTLAVRTGGGRPAARRADRGVRRRGVVLA
jgi:hypothetical protein